MGIHMFTAERFRTQASENAESIKNTDIPSEIRKFEQSMERFGQLAQNEDWLADNFDKMVRSQDVRSADEAAEKLSDGEAVAKIEEHVLRCLGAAVMMQWDTIPNKLQRELFDTAGSLGDVLQTVALRGRIARFLYGHKRQGIPAVGMSKLDRDERNAHGA
jgi:molybdopterin converting factor small subunit